VSEFNAPTQYNIGHFGGRTDDPQSLYESHPLCDVFATANIIVSAKIVDHYRVFHSITMLIRRLM